MKFDSWEKCLYETSGENGDFQKLIDCCEDIIEVPFMPDGFAVQIYRPVQTVQCDDSRGIHGRDK